MMMESISMADRRIRELEAAQRKAAEAASTPAPNPTPAPAPTVTV